MKKTFLLMSLLLGFVVSGMLFASCGDDDDEGGNAGNSELINNLKGTWEMTGDADDWYPFWEVTDKNVYFYAGYDDMEAHRPDETYTYTVKANNIIRLVDVRGVDKWCDVKVVSVTSDKLVVYWDYEDGDYEEKLIFYRVK